MTKKEQKHLVSYMVESAMKNNKREKAVERDGGGGDCLLSGEGSLLRAWQVGKLQVQSHKNDR